MSRPYALTALALLVAGAFVVVSTFAFSDGTASAIGFGVAIGAYVASLAAQLVVPAERRAAHRGLMIGIALVSAWTVLVAVDVFGDDHVWLVFAGGVAIATGALVAIASDVLSRGRRTARRPVAVAQAA
jgi:hypothetical protein